MSQLRKGVPLSEDHRRKLSLAHQGQKPRPVEFTPEVRKRMSDAQRANPNRYWLGKSVPEDTREKIAAKLRGRPGPNLGRESSVETREKLRARWATYSPEERRARVRKAKTSICARPNVLERDVNAALEALFPGEWRYNASEMVGDRIPDFLHVSGTVLEIFGDYWHRGDNPADLVAEYRALGVVCFVVWESDFRSSLSSLRGLLHV